MNSNDWLSALDALKAGGTLPEGAPEVVQEEPAPKTKKPTLHIVLDKKQRHGKTATIIEGFDCPEEELLELARNLKTAIGTGGSARGGEILLQGDWRERAATLLRSEGYKVK